MFIVNTLVVHSKVYGNPDLDLHQVQVKNEIAKKFIQNIGNKNKNFPGIMLLKNLKMCPPRFYKHLLQEPQNWKGSIADLDDFKRDLIFYEEEHKSRQCFWNSIKTWQELYHGANTQLSISQLSYKVFMLFGYYLQLYCSLDIIPKICM